MSGVEADLAAAAPIFAALGDGTRLTILARLGPGRPQSIADLTRGLALSRQGVAKHLRVLLGAGVVGCERVGRETRFTLTPAGLAAARRYLDAVAGQWDDAATRLQAHLGEDAGA